LLSPVVSSFSSPAYPRDLHSVPTRRSSDLAKLIVWGETRVVALERMRRALRELTIVGIPSSQAFHLRVMDDPEFQRGDLDVTYRSEEHTSELQSPDQLVCRLLLEKKK